MPRPSEPNTFNSALSSNSADDARLEIVALKPEVERAPQRQVLERQQYRGAFQRPGEVAAMRVRQLPGGEEGHAGVPQQVVVRAHGAAGGLVVVAVQRSFVTQPLAQAQGEGTSS